MITNPEQYDDAPTQERTQLSVRIPAVHKELAVRAAHMKNLNIGQYIDALIVADIARNADILHESLVEGLTEAESETLRLQLYWPASSYQGDCLRSLNVSILAAYRI